MKGNPEKYLLQKTSDTLLAILVPTMDPTPATIFPISASNKRYNGTCNHNQNGKSNSGAHQQLHCTISIAPITFPLPRHVRAQGHQNWASIDKKQSYLKHTQYLTKAAKYRTPRTCVGGRQEVVENTEGEHGDIADGHSKQGKQGYPEPFLVFVKSKLGTTCANDNQECDKSYAGNSRSAPAEGYQRV